MLRLQDVASLPLPQFRQLGLLYCRRLAHLTTDRRWAKALRKLELSLGPPMDERMCRDAYNAANSAYVDILRKPGRHRAEEAVACTLVCACSSVANSGLQGNFEPALEYGESLATAQIREIQAGFLRQIETAELQAPALPDAPPAPV